jgi:hypothetical protein
MSDPPGRSAVLQFLLILFGVQAVLRALAEVPDPAIAAQLAFSMRQLRAVDFGFKLAVMIRRPSVLRAVLWVTLHLNLLRRLVEAREPDRAADPGV